MICSVCTDLLHALGSVPALEAACFGCAHCLEPAPSAVWALLKSHLCRSCRHECCMLLWCLVQRASTWRVVFYPLMTVFVVLQVSG